MKTISRIFGRLLLYGCLLSILIFVLLSVPIPLHWFPQTVEDQLTRQGLSYGDGYIILRKGLFLRNFQLEREELSAKSGSLSLRVNFLAGFLRGKWVVKDLSFASLDLDIYQSLEEVQERIFSALEEEEEIEKRLVVHWKKINIDHMRVKGILPVGEEWKFNNISMERKKDEIIFQLFYHLLPGDLRGSLQGKTDELFEMAHIYVKGDWEEISLPDIPFTTRKGKYLGTIWKNREVLGGDLRLELDEFIWEEHKVYGIQMSFQCEEYRLEQSILDDWGGKFQMQFTEGQIFDISLVQMDISLERDGDILKYDLVEERGLLVGSYLFESDRADLKGDLVFSDHDIAFVMRHIPPAVGEYLVNISNLEGVFSTRISKVREVVKEPVTAIEFLDFELSRLKAQFKTTLPPTDELVQISAFIEDFIWKPEKEFFWENVSIDIEDRGNIVLSQAEGSIPGEKMKFAWDFYVDQQFFSSLTGSALLEDLDQVVMHQASGKGAVQLKLTAPYVEKGTLEKGEFHFSGVLPETVKDYLEEIYYLDIRQLEWDGEQVKVEEVVLQSESRETLVSIEQTWTDLARIEGLISMNWEEWLENTEFSDWVFARLGRNARGDFKADFMEQTGEIHLANEEQSFRSNILLERDTLMITAEVPGTWINLDYDFSPRLVKAGWDIEFDSIEKEVTEALHRFLDEQLEPPWKNNIRIVNLKTRGSANFYIDTKKLQLEGSLTSGEFVFHGYDGKFNNIEFWYSDERLSAALKEFHWGNSKVENLNLKTSIIRGDKEIVVDYGGEVFAGFQFDIQQFREVFEPPQLKLFELEEGIIKGQVQIARKVLKSVELELEGLQASSYILPYRSIRIHEGWAEGSLEESKGKFVLSVDDISNAEVEIRHVFSEKNLSLYFDSKVEYFDISHFIDNFKPGTIRGTFPKRDPEKEPSFRLEEVRALFEVQDTRFVDWNLSSSEVEIYFLSGFREFYVRGKGDDVYGGKASYTFTFQDKKMKHEIQAIGMSVPTYWNRYMEKKEPFLGNVDWNLDILEKKGKGKFTIHGFQLTQVELMSKMRQVLLPPFGAIVDELKFDELTGSFEVDLDKKKGDISNILAQNALVKVYAQGEQLWEEEYFRLDISLGISTRYLTRITGLIPGLSQIVTFPLETINKLFGGMLFLSYENRQGEDRFFIDTRVREIFQRDGIIRRYFGSE